VPEGITVVEEQVPPPPAAAVAEAQRRLEAEGLYFGPETGVLTPAVRVSIAQYQRLHELPVTGNLDARTAAALGLGNLAAWPDRPPAQEELPAPEGPTAAQILQREEVPALPQPPPGALAEARAAAARLLAIGTTSAAEEVAGLVGAVPAETAGDRPAGGAPAPGAEVRAAEAEAARILDADLRGAEQAASRAEGALGSARREAFAILLEARRAGGWALLPRELIVALEEALQARSLLLRGSDGKLGPDDEAAIRWVQRSYGLEANGLPTLPLLEVLGIDPSPMFEAP